MMRESILNDEKQRVWLHDINCLHLRHSRTTSRTFTSTCARALSFEYTVACQAVVGTPEEAIDR